MNFHFDLETADPDDLMALCLLATHPRVHLRSVSIFPGGLDQYQLVRHVLLLLDRGDVSIGLGVPKKDAQRVSSFYKIVFGDWNEVKIPDIIPSATEVIAGTMRLPGSHLLTGAALTNIYIAHESLADFHFDEWTCQGGFAGDNIVPDELRLPKFRGHRLFATYNLNGNPEAAHRLLSSPRFGHVHMVSKNVCHGFIYDEVFQDRISRDANPGLQFLKRMADGYLRRGAKKALHDVLAALLAIRPSDGIWARVRPIREAGKWGSEPVSDADPGVHIIISIRDSVFESLQ